MMAWLPLIFMKEYYEVCEYREVRDFIATYLAEVRSVSSVKVEVHEIGLGVKWAQAGGLKRLPPLEEFVESYSNARA